MRLLRRMLAGVVTGMFFERPKAETTADLNSSSAELIAILRNDVGAHIV